MGKINESFHDQNQRQQESSKPQAIRKFPKMSSGNVLGASFWHLTMGINDTDFGGEFTDMKKGIRHR